MLYFPFQQWDVEFGKTSNETVPWEKVTHGTNSHHLDIITKEVLLNYNNFGSTQKAARVSALLIAISKKRSFKGGHTSNITAETYRDADHFLLSEAQQKVNFACKQYKTLNLKKNQKYLWVVGANRLTDFNPLDSKVRIRAY